MCGPSRAALFKGLYSSRTGVIGNSYTYLMSDTDTIATRIRSRGFSTVLSGKYLNDFPWPAAPPRPAVVTYVPPGLGRVERSRLGQLIQNPGAWSTDYVFRFAAEQVLDHAGATPMFLWVGPTDPTSRPTRRPATPTPALLPPKAPTTTRPTSATSRRAASPGS